MPKKKKAGYEMATKRSGSKARAGAGAKGGKPTGKRELRDLDARKAKGIRGGDGTITNRKAGKGQL